eukprot:GEMP01008671.1.p1 GENE.GEMP01008671.1~~GEMP01008671.1.p1  ORF type:complete len:267 (+),score=21.74 GEMP01008671.1:90-890(+)
MTDNSIATLRKKDGSILSVGSGTSNASSRSRASLVHARVRSVDSLIIPKAGAEQLSSAFSHNHARVRSLDATKACALFLEDDNDQHPRASASICSSFSNRTGIYRLNFDVLCGLLQYLSKEEILILCISSAKCFPQLWVAASVELNRHYVIKAVSCREVSILTEIASEGQVAIQEEVCRANEGLTMMLLDVRRFQRNEPRFEVEFHDAIAEEKNLSVKFQACVDILQEVMMSWSAACNARDEVAVFSQKFHARVRAIWNSKGIAPV